MNNVKLELNLGEECTVDPATNIVVVNECTVVYPCVKRVLTFLNTLCFVHYRNNPAIIPPKM